MSTPLPSPYKFTRSQAAVALALGGFRKRIQAWDAPSSALETAILSTVEEARK